MNNSIKRNAFTDLNLGEKSVEQRGAYDLGRAHGIEIARVEPDKRSGMFDPQRKEFDTFAAGAQPGSGNIEDSYEQGRVDGYNAEVKTTEYYR